MENIMDQDALDTALTRATETIKKLASRENDPELMKHEQELNNLIKETNKVHVLITGPTKAGKSTLGCYLVDGPYFVSSNVAETYVPTKLFSLPEHPSDSPKICLKKWFKYEHEGVPRCEELPVEDEEGLEEAISQTKRSQNGDSGLQSIEIFVKGLNSRIGLAESVVLQDTPGSDEKTFLPTVTNILSSYQGTSVVVVVVPCTGGGTLETQSLEIILDVFKYLDQRIIFVFTNVLNLLKKCGPKRYGHSNGKSKIEEANETLAILEAQMKEKYPQARFVLFDNDDDDEKVEATLYQKHSLQLMERDQGANNPDLELVNIGKGSIDYLRSLINEIAITEQPRFALEQQKKKLLALRKVVNESHSIFSTNSKVGEKIEMFRKETDRAFDEVERSTDEAFLKAFGFDPERDVDNFKMVLREIIQKTASIVEMSLSRPIKKKSDYIKRLVNAALMQLLDLLRNKLTNAIIEQLKSFSENLQTVEPEVYQIKKERQNQGYSHFKTLPLNNDLLL